MLLKLKVSKAGIQRDAIEEPALVALVNDPLSEQFLKEPFSS